jgi:DNA-binding transcriptional LysR family regulator
MHITFNQLKVFREVARQLSITKAAQALHMTQPGVSMQLKQLELQVGLPLTEVIGKKLSLTDTGQTVLLSAQKIKDELQFLRETVAALKTGVQGHLKIGAVTTAQHFLPHLLGQFHRQYPQVTLSLKIRNRQEVLERLYHNQDDLVVLSQLPEDAHLISKQILEDALVCICPNSLWVPPTSLQNLWQLPWLLREEGSGTRMVMERYFKDHHFQADIAMELGSGEAIIEAVSAGIGVSILPRSALPDNLQLKNIRTIDIEEPLPPHIWYAVFLKNKKILPAAMHFLELSNLHPAKSV